MPRKREILRENMIKSNHSLSSCAPSFALSLHLSFLEMLQNQPCKIIKKKKKQFSFCLNFVNVHVK